MFLVLSLFVLLARSQYILSLNGDDWSSTNGFKNVTMQAKCHVPGDIYGDLMSAGIIGDPFYRYGDLDYRWVAFNNWTYTKNFTFPSDVPLWTKALLVMEGVQVRSDVYLNGKLIGQTYNQFLQYQFDVSHAVARNSTNVLEVALTSSVLYATSRFEEYKLKPMPIAPSYLVGLPHRNFIRAEQSSFGWDWGPAFAPVGIYRDVELRLFSPTSVSIEDVVPHVFPLPFNKTVDRPLTDSSNQFWVQFRVFIKSQSGATLLLKIQGGTSLNNVEVQVPFIGTQGQVHADWNLTNVALWWPNGYGQQIRHNVTTSVWFAGNQLASFTFLLGIRSVELITFGDPLHYRPQEVPPEPLDVSDRPVMFFRINGVPVFAKGANLIPFDAFQSRVNDSVMSGILDSAVNANMNMIRVWGGGLFPTSSFYEMCDERGLMVWQEMIFACSEYPIDPDFLSNVTAEISFQLRRLGRHVSITMWSGNNENDIYDKGPGSPYEVLDYDTVLASIIREDTSRPIWPSSPSTGFSSGVTPSGLPAGTLSHPLPFKVGGDSGDTHYYNYFTCPNISVYPRSNFGSEFGFQSLPWFDNFAPVSEQQDWSLFSDLMNHRQHHPDGNEQIAQILTQNFKVPNLTSTALDVFKRVIYLSQLQQLLCIADESSYYRRGRNMPYRTMGSLYWQLNQNWQAPSWTSIEYGGEWKALHYAMRVVYDTYLVSAFYNQTSDLIVSHVASDNLKDSSPIIATVFLVPFQFGGGTPLQVAVMTLESVPALSGLFYWNISQSELLQQHPTLCPTAGHCFLRFSLVSSITGTEICSPYSFWLIPVKDALLDNSTIVNVNLTSKSLNVAQLTVSINPKNGAALYVLLRSTFSGVFDRNLLTLFNSANPSTAMTAVQFTSSKPLPSNFYESISVEYLNQMWN